MSPVSVTQISRNVAITQTSSDLTVQSGSPTPATHATYTHNQTSASSTWTIVHNLACRPSVTIVDSGGNVQIGEVLYDSDNQVTVTFAAAFSGYAYLN